MRIVGDTNVIVSAFLWSGVPRQLLNAEEGRRIELFTGRALIAWSAAKALTPSRVAVSTPGSP